MAYIVFFLELLEKKEVRMLHCVISRGHMPRRFYMTSTITLCLAGGIFTVYIRGIKLMSSRQHHLTYWDFAKQGMSVASAWHIRPAGWEFDSPGVYPLWFFTSVGHQLARCDIYNNVKPERSHRWTWTNPESESPQISFSTNQEI